MTQRLNSEVEQRLSRAAAILKDLHEESLAPREVFRFELGAQGEQTWLLARLHDLDADRALELKIELPAEPDDALLDLGLDFLAGVIDEYLQGGREAHPDLEPRPYTFEGQTFLLSGQLRRPKLEAQADALLAAASPKD